MKNQQITFKKYHLLIIAFLFIAAACGSGGGGDGSGGTTPTTPPDTTAPSVTLSAPANSASISSLNQVVIDFSEEVLNTDQLPNYTLAGIGQGTLSLQSVSATTTQATLAVNGLVGNGAITLDLQNITDVAGNALVNPALSFTGTTTNPTQAAMPASGNLLNNMASVTITYSKEVTGADILANYTLNGAGIGSLSPTAVTLVTPANFEYRVDFTGAPADGAMTLTIANIQDLVGNPLAGTQINYTFDVTGPTVTTLTPGTGSTLNQITGFDITYSEPVTGATIIANHILTGTALGTLQIAAIVANVSPANSYHVTLSGAPATTGTLNFSVQNVTDALGNVMTPAGASYTIDQINPTATASLTPGIWIGVFNPLTTLDITFSKPVLNAALTSSYSLSGSTGGNLSLQSVTNLGGNVYRLNFTGAPTTPSGSGSISINLSGTTQITDANSNPVAATSFTYNVDTLRPTVIKLSPNTKESYDGMTGSEDISRSFMGSSNMVEITFSEAMTGATQISNYTLSGTALGTLQLWMAGNLGGGNTYQVYFTGKPAGTGTVILTMNAVDQAGNTVSTPVTYQIVPSPLTSTLLGRVASGSLLDLAWNGTDRFVGVGGTSIVGTIYTSTDGLSWTAGAGCTSDVMNSVTWANSRWVAVGKIGGQALICNSFDGINWTSNTAFSGYATAEMTSVIWHPSLARFIALGSAISTPICSSSVDGITWLAVHTCTGASTRITNASLGWNNSPVLTGMAGYGFQVFRMGSYTPATGDTTWNAYDIQPPSTWNVMGYAFNGSKDVIAGYDSTTSSGVVSSNNFGWNSPQPLGPLPYIRDVLWNGSYFLLLADGGTVITSSDANLWSVHQLESSTTIFQTAIWVGPYWLATDWSGNIFKFQ